MCMLFIDFPSDGVLLGNSMIEYFITLFLIIWGSDIMGIMISSVANTPNVAMTAMPFVLILQLIMSGVLFKLKPWANFIAKITFSKWGIYALGCIGDIADGLDLKIISENPEFGAFIKREDILSEDTIESYEHIASNLLSYWGIIVIISVACICISIISLKIRNKDS